MIKKLHLILLTLSMAVVIVPSAHAELTDRSGFTKADIITTHIGNLDAYGVPLSNNKSALERMDFATIKTQAEQGNKDAQFYLAKMYQLGVHTDTDIEQAQLWYQKSADNGNTHAMNNLAALIHLDWANGKSSTYTQTINLLEKAAKQKNPVAMTNLGKQYILSNKIQEGIVLLKQAGELGYAPAYYQLYHLLDIFVKPDGSSKDDIKRMYGYLGRAADMGYPPAISSKKQQIDLSLLLGLTLSKNRHRNDLITDIVNYQVAKLSCLDGAEPACQDIKTINDKYNVDAVTSNLCSQTTQDNQSCQDRTNHNSELVKKLLRQIDGVHPED